MPRKKYNTKFPDEDFRSITVTLPHDMLSELHKLGAARHALKQPYTISALLREGVLLVLSQENIKSAKQSTNKRA